MTPGEAAILMLVSFVIVIMLGFPIAFTLMAMGLAFGYWAYYDPLRMQSIFDNVVFDLFVQKTYGVMASDVLVSIPLFLFMGYVIERANVVEKLFTALYISAKRLPGALAVATLVTCALFATATGIVGAVVTLMGILALPAMLKARYDVGFASGVICAGGCLGILIPPSIMLIVYSQTASVSVVQLYAAAFIPGFLLATLYLIYVLTRASMKPSLAPKPNADDIPDYSALQTIVLLLTSFVPLAVLIISVLGAIMFGLATPSEAAAIGALGALVLALAYRALTWERLKESVYLTVRTSAMVCWLFVGSGVFSSVFSYLGGEEIVKEFVLSLNLTPIMFLILAQLIIFLLGYPLEWSEIIIIFIPIFLPLLPIFNIDPIFFGVLVALNLQTSVLTPPVAMSAFYLKGVAPPEVRLAQIFRGVIPYLGIVIFTMVLIYIFPGLALYLPNAFYSR
jgi:tripartite ATP-independent transporter DctM subunit